MDILNGKTAFITGGASGIGLALAEALGRRGLNVFIADIDRGALSEAQARLKSLAVIADGVTADVTKRASLQSAVEHCTNRFGPIHLLVNSAGVLAAAPFGALSPGDWNWLIDVNIKGVVNGVEVVVPAMLRHGEGGHIVNVASMAGFQTAPNVEAYAATKAAVIGMSEAWRIQLADTGVSVSVVCPGAVRTNIAESRRNRGAEYGGALHETPTPATQARLDQGMAAQVVAARILEGIEADELHIFTHVEYRAEVEARLDDILKAFDRVDESPVMKEEAHA